MNPSHETRSVGRTISDLLDFIKSGAGRVNCIGLAGSERAYAVQLLQAGLKRSVLLLCADDKAAKTLLQDLQFFFAKSEIPVFSFPDYDVLPFEPVSYDAETSCERIAAMYRLMTENRPSLIVAPVCALMQKVIPKAALSRFVDYFLPGESIDRDAFLHKLKQGGYQETILVEEPGDYAARGSLVDFFPPSYVDPVRIEFDGDIVESIRTFSAEDQRTLRLLPDATVLPARESVLESLEIDRIARQVRERGQSLGMAGMRLESMIERLKGYDQIPGIGGMMSVIHSQPGTRLGTIMDYLAAETVAVVVDPGAVEKAAIDLESAVNKHYVAARNDGLFCVEPEELFLSWTQLADLIHSTSHVVIKTLHPGSGLLCDFSVSGNEEIVRKVKARDDPDSLLRPLADWLRDMLNQGMSSYIVCHTTQNAERLESLLKPYGINWDRLNAFVSSKDGPPKTAICLGQITSGFVWPDERLAIITEDEIFGPKRRLPKVRREASGFQWTPVEELTPNDLVVHTEHGIGRYRALVKLDVAGMTNDFLLIEYRDGDKLYVPVDRMNSVQKYVGVDGIEARLDKMGGVSWDRVKNNVKKTIQKMAGALLNLYAARKVQQGHAFSLADKSFQDFEASFAFTETPDQIRAIEDVVADMTAATPMDRLICGDVGYGKTEIALRAAFLAVWDNKQIAILVPTTVLAEQHYRTFKKRFESYPVVVETLSRFRSASEQKSVVQKLKEGKVDIVIGTHRLLQKDVEFSNLGLLIIDEEQRFGVAHKERLKQLRQNVDVLALTATPIPRTLHMSLMGVRDLSVIATPPEYRYPIKTYVCPYDDAVAAEAINRELQRGGQVFFVHNNVQTIWATARHLQELVPGTKVGVAHGQLHEDELEKVMFRFLNGEINLLVCTTIIESGLDIPSANTILIDRADRFGLSQIYQIRGRVGRGDEQAYAYLFIPPETNLTRDAQKRLKVLMEHSDLGSGFQIAMSDLQIRGGGTILGPTQSGQIASVGYEMFLQLMERAVGDIKGEPVEQEAETEIVVNCSAYVPETYIGDIGQRLTTYKNLARIKDLAELELYGEELKDRFGVFPDPVAALFEKIGLKVLCQQFGVRRLEIGAKGISLAFDDKICAGATGEAHRIAQKIASLVQRDPRRFQLTPEGVLYAKAVTAKSITAISITTGVDMSSARRLLEELAS